jgi:uncharacterized membrane protein YbhN (UPF0104 family)
MIGVAGVLVLVYFGSIDFGVLGRATRRPELLALAFVGLLLTVPIAACRWWMLLRGLQLPATMRWSLGTTFISLFFNTFLPGAYGGDLVRLALAYRALGKLNRLTISVIVDRLSGLAALLLLGLGMLPALPVAYANRLGWVAAGLVVAGVVGLCIALRWGDWLIRQLGRLPGRTGPILQHIAREVLAALAAYVARPGLLLATLALSLVQFVLVLLALIAVGWAMGFVELDWAGYMLAGIWSLVANALPVTPGGIGVGEAAFAHAASMLSHSASTGAAFGTVFLALRLVSIAVGMIGIVPWLTHRSELRDGIRTIKSGEGALRSS